MAKSKKYNEMVCGLYETNSVWKIHKYIKSRSISCWPQTTWSSLIDLAVITVSWCTMWTVQKVPTTGQGIQSPSPHPCTGYSDLLPPRQSSPVCDIRHSGSDLVPVPQFLSVTYPLSDLYHFCNTCQWLLRYTTAARCFNVCRPQSMCFHIAENLFLFLNVFFFQTELELFYLGTKPGFGEIIIFLVLAVSS